MSDLIQIAAQGEEVFDDFTEAAWAALWQRNRDDITAGRSYGSAIKKSDVANAVNAVLALLSKPENISVEAINLACDTYEAAGRDSGFVKPNYMRKAIAAALSTLLKE